MNVLPAGLHKYRVQIADAGIYFMTARQNGKSSTVKMVNNGHGTVNLVEYVGVENANQTLTQTKGSVKGATNNPFSFGDQMEYVGYATINGTEVESQRIERAQGASQYFTLLFADAQLYLPTVTTSAVTNITDNSAICGGCVTNDGGATVIDRGVCYDTTGMPTVSNNCLHIGTGIGTYSQSLTGLTAGTTYTLRAYAINSVGVAYGDPVTFTTAAPPVTGQPCPSAATLTDVDGNVYITVQIGQQCWMKENLKTTRYADGMTIPLGSTTSYDDAYRYCPNNNSGNVSTYGYLYNWPAVMHNSYSSNTNPSGVQGICPNGWHVPSVAEWTQLTNYVKSQPEYVSEGCTGTDDDQHIYCIAKALASQTGWSSSTNDYTPGNNPSANNATGFSAISAGFYGEDGYINFGNDACFWSSSQVYFSSSCSRSMTYDINHVHCNIGTGRYYGLSVRCLKD